MSTCDGKSDWSEKGVARLKHTEVEGMLMARNRLLYRSVPCIVLSDLGSQCLDVRSLQYADEIEVLYVDRDRHLAWTTLAGHGPAVLRRGHHRTRNPTWVFLAMWTLQGRYRGWTIRLQLERSLGRAWPSFILSRGQSFTCSGPWILVDIDIST